MCIVLHGFHLRIVVLQPIDSVMEIKPKHVNAILVTKKELVQYIIVFNSLYHLTVQFLKHSHIMCWCSFAVGIRMEDSHGLYIRPHPPSATFLRINLHSSPTQCIKINTFQSQLLSIFLLPSGPPIFLFSRYWGSISLKGKVAEAWNWPFTSI